MTRSSDYKVPDGDVDPQAEAQKKYRRTEKGKKAIKRDNVSESHTKAQLKYARSAKGKEAVARWRNSDKGKAYTQEKAEERARAVLMLEREEQGLCELCGSADHEMSFHINGVQK